MVENILPCRLHLSDMVRRTSGPMMSRRSSSATTALAQTEQPTHRLMHGCKRCGRALVRMDFIAQGIPDFTHIISGYIR